MRKLFFASILALSSLSSVSAQDACSSDVLALQALYDARNAMARGADSWEVTERLNEHLHRMREPLRDGGYRWVRFVRPNGDGPVVKLEKLVQTDYDSEELETLEGEATAPFAVRVTVPRKRSLLKANNEVFVDTLKIRYWVEGEEETLEKPIGQWLRPDNSKSFDLGVIADRAEATVTVAARGNKLGESLIELHFRQAVPEDDPSGPNYDAIQRVKKLASYLDARTLDDEIARLEARLFGTSRSIPVTVLVEQLREADKLLRSKKTEEQEKGRKILEDTLRLLP